MRHISNNSTLLLILFCATWTVLILCYLYSQSVVLNTVSTIQNTMSTASNKIGTAGHMKHMEHDLSKQRDMQVLRDPLYPALNRTDAPTFNSVAKHTINREFNASTQYGSGDTYRLIGYISNPDDAKGEWKLFGRRKDRHRGEYYLVPVNNMYDIKIQLTDQNTVTRIGDPDAIPETLLFTTPLLLNTPYTFTALPKTSFTDGYF